MKRLLVLLLFCSLMVNQTLSVSAKGVSNGKSHSVSSKTQTVETKKDKDAIRVDTSESVEDATPVKENIGSNAAKQKSKKAFKLELNVQRKEMQSQKSTLSAQKDELEEQYEAMIAAGDTVGAEAIKEQLNGLQEQMSELKAQIKQTINQRYMVVKSIYSEEELAQFESAAALIEKMYADAAALSASSVSVNNHLIKFEAPAYIKGGVTMVPVRAITESLGAEVAWDADTKTVTITKDTTVIQMTPTGTTVTVDGTAVTSDSASDVICGRTYIPLRFLAESLDLGVEWDGDNKIIDIDGEVADDSDTTETDVSTENADSTTDASETVEETTAEDGTSSSENVTTDAVDESLK